VPVTGFKQYIARVQFDTDYYYTAYPCRYDQRCKSRAPRAIGAGRLLGGRSGSNEAGRVRGGIQGGFVVKVQCDLGEAGPPPMGT